MYETGFDLNADVVEYAIQTGVAVEGTKTKEKEGNGIPKGWYRFGGPLSLENYRKQDLTVEPVFGNLRLAAYKARDARLASPGQIPRATEVAVPCASC
jgi:hypothetical protein